MPGSERGLPWTLPAAVAATVAAAMIWIATIPADRLREVLEATQFWMLDALLALVGVASLATLRQLFGHLELRRADKWAAAGAATLAIGLALGVAPATNRIYYDEQIYESVAQNLTDLHRAQMCNQGTVEYQRLQCERSEYNKEPYGYPHLLSVVYRLFGVSSRSPHVLNGLVHGATTWVVFMVTLVFFRDPRAAGFAALAAAIIPEQVLWSHTAASEPASALAAGWVLLAAGAYVRLRSTASLVMVAAAGAYAMTYRPEMPVLALPVAAAIVLMASRELKTGRLWLAAAGAVALSIVSLAHLASVRHEGWGTQGPRLALMFLGPNLRINGWFYLWDARFPVALTALAVFGAWLRRSRAVGVMLLWLLAFAGIYVLFYAGSYDYGADIRYSLLTYAPIAVLAGLGAATLSRTLDARPLTAGRGVSIVVAALTLQATWYLPLMRAVGEEAWAARADVAFAEATAKTLPRNALVLTHNPGMFHVWGISAAQLSIAADQPEYVRRDLNRRYAGGVYIHWNFWCNVSDPVQNAFCTHVLSSFRTTRIAEFRERDYRYAFYRIAMPDGDPAPAGVR
ncbi:MAG TPA: glycosyltransferase family 39 protein [Vicinamibacterales bacterium]